MTSSLHKLGYADVLGRYAVVRGLDDAQEARVIMKALNRMSDDEVSKVIAHRRRHKAAIVLLHEVAHTLGGVHVVEPSAVLFPSYSSEQARLSDDSLALLAHGVTWLHAKNDDERIDAAHALRDEIAKRRASFEGADIDAVLASLDDRIAKHGASAASAASSASSARGFTLSVEDARIFNAAVETFNRGDKQGAYRTLLPLADKADADPHVLSFACYLTGLDGVVALDARARCDRALVADKTSLRPVVGAILAGEKTHDEASKTHAFDEGRRRVAAAPPSAIAATHDDRRDLEWLARAAAAADRLTLAEDALAAADAGDVDGDDHGDAGSTNKRAHIRERIGWQRHRTGVARGAVDGELEAAAVAEIAAILQLVADDAAGAQKRIDEARAKYGDVAGLYAAECDVGWYRHKLKDAARACDAAVAKDDEASVAHALKGVLLATGGRMDAAVVELERAEALDPDTRSTYSILAQVLRRAGKASAADDVAARYRARFGEALR